METYNIAPYYDDFDENSKFYQMLFKPSLAVQTRELTQLQTIIRSQIERFGNHIFQNGSVVIPGNSVSELGVPFIAILKENGNEPYTASTFEGRTLVGLNFGVEAIVREVVEESDAILLYLNYTKGSNGQSETNTFMPNEEMFVKNAPFIIPRVVNSPDAIGAGSLAFVHRGVYYVNGTFALVSDQSIVISRDSITPSCHVVLKIVESIVDYNQDPSLLDNARGEPNENAPGADRVRIDLVLEAIPLGTEIKDNCIELMRYNNGVLEEHSRYPKYSELEKQIARRTYDESGNYLVNGFAHKVREHKKTQYNNGVFVDGDRAKFVVEVAPGKGYIQGLETESIYTRQVVLDKGRTPDHIKYKKSNILAEYGRYLFITDVKGLPNFRTREQIDIYSGNIEDSTGDKIGTARVVAIDYHVGDAETNTAIYKLYIKDLKLDAPSVLHDIGGIQYSNGGSATVLTRFTTPNASYDFNVDEVVTNTFSGRTAKVKRYARNSGDMYVTRHDHTKRIPVVGDQIVGDQLTDTPEASITGAVMMGGVNMPPIFDMPATPLASIKNELGVYDIKYTAWEYVSINTNASGYGQHTVTDGEIVPIEAGTFVAISPLGIVLREKFTVSAGNQLVLEDGPASSVVQIMFQVAKTGATPKTKTLTTMTLTNVSPASQIPLTRADATRIISITSGGVDVTNRYILDSGQTDYYYGMSKAILIGNMPDAPLNIEFEYYEHTGAGDYFSVDSYQSLGDEYVALAPTYRSIATGRDFVLADCLDFRPRVGATGTFDTGSPSLVDTPVMDTFINTSVQYYVPRIDVVVLAKGGGIEVLRGIPKELPSMPKITDEVIGLCSVYIPAYTRELGFVVARSLENYRYTMKDIAIMEDRIDGIEEMSLLSYLESSLVALNVTDPVTGLDKFRTGYLVDNFTYEGTVGDIINPRFQSVLGKGELIPSYEDIPLAEEIIEDNSTNYQITNGQYTLPYTEVGFISQPVSTRVTNVNPFMVVSSNGHLSLEPSFDIWTDRRDAEAIVNTTTITKVVAPPVTRPVPQPQPEVKKKVYVVRRKSYSTTPYDYAPDGTPLYQWQWATWADRTFNTKWQAEQYASKYKGSKITEKWV